MMRDRFWFYIRLRWSAFVILFSVVTGLVLTAVILVITLFNTGIGALDQTNISALLEIASFWFKLSWVLSFLLALMLSFKTLFNRPFAGKELLLLECKSKEPFIPVILVDVIPIWRKFLFWMVWILLVVALILLAVVNVTKTFFGGLTLFIMILLFGVVILKPLLLSMKNVRIKDNQ